MNFPFYQSHEGVVGMSDSRRKWERLQVPEDLTGRTVLDIGCNEGLITSWLAKRNAEKVIGIDFDKPRIDYARLNYSAANISFLCQSWSPLPEGRFDLVLWTSAMHYENDPKSVLQNIWRQLKPDGLLILECGYVGSSGREMVPIMRHSDTRLYPTQECLVQVLLENFAVREVTGAEVTPGDPVPRSVFHCRPRIPTVMFVIGKSRIGKSNLATSHLGQAADKVFSVDKLISRVVTAPFTHNPLQAAIKAHCKPADLSSVYQTIQSGPLLEPFVDWLSQLCVDSDDFVVIEGFLTKETIAAFSQSNLRRRVWVVEKVG